MSKTYHATRTLEIILDASSVVIEAELEYTIIPYVPAQGPSYASGGQPAEGGTVEDVRVTGLFSPEVKTKRGSTGNTITMGSARRKLDCPEWLSDWIVQEVDGASLYDEATERDEGERADYLYDAGRDDREYYSHHPADD